MANNMDAGSNKNRIENKIFDAILKTALEESIDQELSSYPNKTELDKTYPRSAAFDKRITKIIAKEERIYRRRRSIKIFTNIAASIAALFIIGIGTLVFMSTERPGFRQDEFFYEHPIVAFDTATDDVSIENWSADDAFFDFEPRMEYWTPIEEVMLNINGQEVILFEATWDGGYHFITWEYEGSSFQISSNADIEELLTMVKSLIDTNSN